LQLTLFFLSLSVTVRDDHCFNGTNNEVSAKHSYVFGAQLQETTIAGNLFFTL